MNARRNSAQSVAAGRSSRAKGTLEAVAASLFGLAIAWHGVAFGQESELLRPTPPNFDKVGPQVDDQLPNLKLATAKGEPQYLKDAWKSGPALLVTSSLTCPKSRSRWPELKSIIEKYGETLNVVILYVIEAHPVGSVCPYKGVEDITPENELDGILRRQPASLDDRIELAQEFKRYLRVSAPIYIDNMKNEVWKAVGAAPNLALLVDQQGIVVAREGWFDGNAMGPAIDKYLKELSRTEDATKEASEVGWQKRLAARDLLASLDLQWYELRSEIEDKDTAKLAAILKKTPTLANYVFESAQGQPNEATALMQAISYGNLNAVKLLLASGADVNSRTDSIDSALQLAARNGEVEIATILLREGADPVFPPAGESPLHEAALAGHQEMASLIIKAGAKPDIFYYIAFGDSETVRKSLLSEPSLALRPDGAGRMPMDYAAANGRLEIARLLIASGAPVVDAPLVEKDPPLHRAIHRNDLAMVKLLLDAGSSPDTAVGYRGENPRWVPTLHLAVGQQNPGIVKDLLSRKANVNSRNSFSQTALHIAAGDAQADIADLLIKAGADVNARQLGFSLPCGSGAEKRPSNNTPLHYAAVGGTPKTIKALIEAGADLEARTDDGTTPLMATVDSPRYAGAVADPRLPSAEYLVAAGADVNAQNDKGHSILDVAISSLSQETEETPSRQEDLRNLVVLLKKHGAKQGTSKTKNAVREF